MMMGGLILLGVTMVKFKISSTRFMTAMTALGMGIAGFFTGIAVGDWVAQNAKSAAGIDGKSLGSLIENFFGGMSTKAVGMMGGLVTLAGTMALVGGKVGIVKTPMDAVTQAAGLMTGMTAMGLGIAGFFTGIMVGDFIAKNMKTS